MGTYHQNLLRECGDFILRRSDGVYAYQLAVSVDDGNMGITQIVRGRDLLDSTPRQIFLMRLMGFDAPRYYHLPLLIAPDGRRLSKREKDLDMGNLRNKYHSPHQIIGKLAFISGLTDMECPVSIRELQSIFHPEKLRKNDIIISPDMF